MTDEDPGYGFVPFAPDARRSQRPPARWDRRVSGTLAGHIDLTLITQQPVHVGSGSKAVDERVVVQRAARVRGAPGIPGSSLKGAVRARYEAITHSCVLFSPKAGSPRVRSSSGIKRAQLPESALPRAASRKCDPDHACPACALFGCMSLRSRITFTDFACDGDTPFTRVPMPERFGPNLHHVANYRRVASSDGDVAAISTLKGRKFGLGRGPATDHRHRVEAIPANTQLCGQIRVFNVTPAELGGLLTALGCDPPSAIKLGGGKAHGFGRVLCRARCAMTGEVTQTPNQWRSAFVDSADRWAEGEAALVEMQQGDC